ncbi:SRPBCC family protein [Noviherbaspirillum sp. CPCC 100848]|uniref:SRPBCC family protein n=1 Tax=Noviherbaspirillum album TaxID=3080276 RepID=A0ABU6JE36_9BURK|nr:SRPBCC family protein [Noviherbaspirillum sp. CPCC 100848]MEC4721914.1 SRPBCC family protein [Noviherbaspirillum sp. CPCC 100848]
MATIQHSIDVDVPAQTLFNHLTRFEDYGQFMDNVEHVERIDDTHLRWTTTMANRAVEWDSAVTTDDRQRRIAWQDTNGISNSGRLEVQAISEEASRVIFSLEIESGQFPGAMAGDTDAETSQHLTRSLAKLKSFAEGQGSDSGASCGMLRPGNFATAASTSGSPTEVLEDEPNESGPSANFGTRIGTRT